KFVGHYILNRVDHLGRLELHRVDRAGGGERQVGEVLLGEHDHLPPAEVVALRDVVVLDLLTADAADPLIPDAAAVVAVDLVEPDALLLGGRVQLDRDRHQAERDRALPDRPHLPHLLPPVWHGGVTNYLPSPGEYVPLCRCRLTLAEWGRADPADARGRG